MISKFLLIMSIVFKKLWLYFPLTVVGGYLANRYYFSGGKCKSKNRLDGKVVVITGSNTGIGYETALDLAKRGAKIILACRNKELAEKAAEKIRSETCNQNVEVELLDLADLSSVRNFAKNIKSKLNRLDILINNAGVMNCPPTKTKDGFEIQFGVNHLGHFLLTNLLLDLIKQSQPSRIINVSSIVHEYGKIYWDDLMLEKSYGANKAYRQSKVANVLFTLELANRLKDTNVIAVSLHPGVVRTELGRYEKDGLGLYAPILKNYILWPIWWLFTKNSHEGAQTTIHCAVADDIISGAYYSDCKTKTPARAARSPESAKRLWEISKNLVGLTDKNKAE